MKFDRRDNTCVHVDWTCKCRRSRGNCPLNDECLTTNVLYEAEVFSTEPNHSIDPYVGIAEPEFKTRLNNHKCEFNNEHYANATQLSKKIWEIKRRGFDVEVKWRILKQLPSNNPANKKCLLCIGEKLEILERNEHLLNKRSELISKCRHKAKFLLNKYDAT